MVCPWLESGRARPLVRPHDLCFALLTTESDLVWWRLTTRALTRAFQAREAGAPVSKPASDARAGHLCPSPA